MYMYNLNQQLFLFLKIKKHRTYLKKIKTCDILLLKLHHILDIFLE